MITNVHSRLPCSTGYTQAATRCSPQCRFGTLELRGLSGYSDFGLPLHFHHDRHDDGPPSCPLINRIKLGRPFLRQSAEEISQGSLHSRSPIRVCAAAANATRAVSSRPSLELCYLSERALPCIERNQDIGGASSSDRYVQGINRTRTGPRAVLATKACALVENRRPLRRKPAQCPCGDVRFKVGEGFIALARLQFSAENTLAERARHVKFVQRGHANTSPRIANVPGDRSALRFKHVQLEQRTGVAIYRHRQESRSRSSTSLSATAPVGKRRSRRAMKSGNGTDESSSAGTIRTTGWLRYVTSTSSPPRT